MSLPALWLFLLGGSMVPSAGVTLSVLPSAAQEEWEGGRVPASCYLVRLVVIYFRSRWALASLTFRLGLPSRLPACCVSKYSPSSPRFLKYVIYSYISYITASVHTVYTLRTPLLISPRVLHVLYSCLVLPRA